MAILRLKTMDGILIELDSITGTVINISSRVRKWFKSIRRNDTEERRIFLHGIDIVTMILIFKWAKIEMDDWAGEDRHVEEFIGQFDPSNPIKVQQLDGLYYGARYLWIDKLAKLCKIKLKNIFLNKTPEEACMIIGLQLNDANKKRVEECLTELYSEPEHVAKKDDEMLKKWEEVD